MSTFVAGVLGAVVGALAAGAVTYYIGPKVQERIRGRERNERAIESILEVLETDHWDRLNHLEYLNKRRSDVRARLKPRTSDEDVEDLVEQGNEATDDLSRGVSELMASARRLRLFASRVDNPAFRDCFGKYLIAALQLDISARVASERTEAGGKAWGHVLDPETMMRGALRDLLRDGNRLLGVEWWDPDDVTRFLPDSDEGP